MSQFSRRARWLNQIFVPSVAPTTADPSVVSDDVSLVQTYDGGAIGIANPSFPLIRDGAAAGAGVPLLIESPEVAIRAYLSPVGININGDMFSLPTGLYARILAFNTNLNAGLSPTAQWETVNVPTGTPGGGFQVNITKRKVVTVSIAESRGLMFNLLPPGMMLKSHHTNGDASTQLRHQMLWIVAPVGMIIINSSTSGNDSP